MAAGVHLPWVGGGIVKTRLLLNGQTVHICPEDKGLFFPKVKETAKGVRYRMKDLAAGLLQGGLDVSAGLWKLPVQLRDPVQGHKIMNNLQNITP